jgi:MoaA/NifB/PqqE/SkfB family radical SAM enzyme
MKFLRLSRFGWDYVSGKKIQGVGLILTRRCNLSCKYCKIKDNASGKRELSVAQWKKAVDNFAKNGHRHFIFTGGEPMLYSGLSELMDYTSKKALTSLITNASYLDDQTFPGLKNLDFLTFSRDSLGKDGTFEKDALPRLELISRWCRKLKITPSAIITVTSKNVKEVPDIVRKIDRYGISILLSYIHSSGEDSYEFRNHVPELEFRTRSDFQDLAAFQETMLRMKRDGFRIAESDNFIRNMINFAQGRYRLKCPATDPFFTVDVDGRIKPCHDIPASGVSALDFQDYFKMKHEVSKCIPAGCNCYYDCYFNSQDGFKNLLFQLLHR